jgi:CHAT domain-containing protein
MSGVVFAPFPENLPASRSEADAIVRALPRSFSKNVGGTATERRLRRTLASGAIVHVATHGILNARHPMFSRIELAVPSRPVPDDDGRLEVHEIPGLRIRSPLVFLSGCETGIGNEWSSDPSVGSHQMTLAHAFLNAGAGGVIATFWRIDDVSAAGFAESFYEAMSRLSPADALAAAQRAMIGSARYASPFHWAAYALSGGLGQPAAQERSGPSVP